MYDLNDNKGLNLYFKELAKLTKELGDTAKRNHETDSGRSGNFHKRIYKAHKGLHAFIAVLQENEASSVAKITMELFKRTELRNVIPENAAGWNSGNIVTALQTRCKK